MNSDERQARFKEWALTAPRIGGGEPYSKGNIEKNIMPCVRNGGSNYGRLIGEAVPDNLFETDDVSLINRLHDAVKEAPNLDADHSTGLWLYAGFLASQGSAIDTLIEEYSEVFGDFRENEIYKWEAVKCFQENWDSDAADFGEMLKSALAKSDNLLAGSMYMPKGMLLIFAKLNPEKVRHALVDVLFDEDMDLVDRMKDFSAICDDLLEKENNRRLNVGEKPAKNGYQDPRAMNVYLTFAHPDKHYLYKSSMYTSACKRLGIQPESGKYDKVIGYRSLCDEILSRLNEKYPSLISDSDASMDSSLLEYDPEHHLLVQDIVYYVDSYSKDYGWFPKVEDYDPGISSDEWVELLDDPTITTENTLTTLACLKSFPDGATCSELAGQFGRNPNFYLNGIVSFAKRVKARTGCPTSPRDEGGERYWAIPCIGKNVTDRKSGNFAWKLRQELQEALDNGDFDGTSLYGEEKTEVEPMEPKLGNNIILYGPPGTGKTYSVAALAWLVSRDVEPTKEALGKLSEEEMAQAKAWYDAQLADIEGGQVAFTTFHQSYGYEEFIEGIRPIINEEQDDTSLEYGYEDGIFKEFCSRASKPVVIDKTREFGLNDDPVVWKVSLGGTGDNPVRTECLKNGHIRIGWDSYGPNITDETDFSNDGGKNVLTAFETKMRKGDIVLSCYSATTIDAIGVITGEPEWHDEHGHYKRQRDVSWITKGISFDIVEKFGVASMTLSTIYKLKLDASDVLKIVEEAGGGEIRMTLPNTKPYIFVIDEINRGNISKIFGELITLIEPSKRAGQPDAQIAILPYTKKLFSVPANITIIGTMNTADRSIALMDTALRRRFRFVEMAPDYEVLKSKVGSIDGIDVSEVLKRMNERISVLIDRDHTIGHAYFMSLHEDSGVDELASVFRDRIVPLLQEYFYDDYEKIRLVLADNQKGDKSSQFVVECETASFDALFGDSDFSYEDMRSYRINDSAFYLPESYLGIYE